MYFAATEPHVPRMPATMFKGRSGLGYRGDAILQLDWLVGEIVKEVEAAGLTKNTIIIFTSDNGPVLNDGYEDGAVTQLNGHTPLGSLRGGKYSTFEGGTRVPFIIRWPERITAKTSSALISQMDLFASFAKLLNITVPAGNAIDSENQLNALLGQTLSGRKIYVEQAGALAIIQDEWKYISPSNGDAFLRLTQIESGNSPKAQLYNLKQDIGEKNNLADQYPEKVKELEMILKKIKEKN